MQSEVPATAALDDELAPCHPEQRRGAERSLRLGGDPSTTRLKALLGMTKWDAPLLITVGRAAPHHDRGGDIFQVAAFQVGVKALGAKPASGVRYA